MRLAGVVRTGDACLSRTSKRRDKYGAGQARWLSSAFERSIHKMTGSFERGFYTHFGGI
jgi:hypothetical protein